jgi:HTH-type transcriptional regulator/antitoxin HigA
VDIEILRDADGGVAIGLAEDDQERRANETASNILVPQDEMESFIRRLAPYYSKERIVQFAHRMKIHPGIIVGQLQHRQEIGYHALREFLLKVRSVVSQTALTDGWGQVAPRFVTGG